MVLANSLDQRKSLGRTPVGSEAEPIFRVLNDIMFPLASGST